MPMRRHLYPGGIGYPSLITWELISALIRYVRARNRCEWCNIANGQIRMGLKGDYRVILTTAHLDHDKRNSLDPANLAALCQRCHLTYDAPMKHARRRHGEDQLELVPFDPNQAITATKRKLGL